MSNNNSENLYITCPTCGRQYLPAEIYYPNNFFGKPTDIDRVGGTKIDSYCGSGMDLHESYECDNCYCKFEVTAKISFKVSQVKKYDMSKAYVTKLFDDKITLDESVGQ